MATRLSEIPAADARQLLPDWPAILRTTSEVRIPAQEPEEQCNGIPGRLAQGIRDGNVTEVRAIRSKADLTREVMQRTLAEMLPNKAVAASGKGTKA